jgi:putative transposase
MMNLLSGIAKKTPSACGGDELAIDNEEIKHHDEYVGKRVKRGLFKSKDGILINADVNSAINIARKSKVTGMREIANSLKGIVAFPKRIRIANK